jgi:ATP-binding cassette subfamily B protein
MSSKKSLKKSLPGLFRFIKKFSPILSKQKALISGSFFALFAEMLLRLLEPWPLKFIIDHVIVTEHSRERLKFLTLNTLDPLTLIAIACISIVIIAQLRGVAMYYNKVGFALIGNRLLTEVRGILFRHLQRLSLRFHNKARSGDMVVRVTNDIGRLKEAAVTVVMPLIGSLFILVCMCGIMFWLNWQLTLLAMSTFPLFWFTTVRISRKVKDVSRKQREREGDMANTAAETIGAIKVIQSMHLEKLFSNRFSSQNKKSLKESVKGKRLMAGLQRIVKVINAVATALVLWFGARLVLRAELSLGELLVFLAYLKNAFMPIRNFTKYTGRLAKASAAGERVLDVLDEKPEVYDMPGAADAPSFKGEVCLDKVCFSYEHNHKVLENISFSVLPGQKIALVGGSGKGKSTLVSLVLRLYDPTHGRVMIDGRDIREYSLTSLRSQISIVLQDTILFATSVRDNIGLGDSNATPEEIEAAAKRANAHEFIEALSEGYETILSERGISLSSGQRQRIAIARSIIRRAPILILDEPTTGLDEENEREIIESLELLARESTTFLITHNLNHASRADLIMYLENGSIIESGSHDELIQMNRHYAKMYKLQVYGRQKTDSEIFNVVN